MGNWYRNGTVAVTNGSPDVVGVGTLWTAQAAVGDIFIGPDDVEYEIAVIPDDTHLSIKQKNGTAAYAGATASAQGYAIVRNFTSTLPAQLASQLAALMTSYHVSMDELTAWLSGTGSVTVHDAVGNAYTVQTPAALAATIGGRLSKSVAGGSNVTLTSTEASNLFIELTGTLTGNINVIVPASARSYFFYNATSGAYTVTIKTASGTGVAVPQGGRVLLECDATNVVNPLENIAGNQTVSGNHVVTGDQSVGGALTAGIGTFTKTTAGDVARFTNAAASNKSLYIYTDATYAAIGSGTGAGGNNMAFNAVTNSISWATNSAVRMTLDASGNLGLGVTPPATYAGIKSFHVGGAGSSMMTSADHAVTYFTNNLTLTDNWRYEIAGYAGSVYYQSAGAHVWLSKTGNLGAGNLPATSLTGMTLDASGNLGVGNSSGISRLQVYGSNSDNLPVANFRQDGASANIIEGAVAAGALRFVVAYTGNVTNTNNSYGAISDIKLKQDIVDAKSQWADVKALTVRKFRFKTDPTGFLMMGLIAQEAEAVSPGLVETTDDFEDVVIEPARTEIKIVQRQKTQKVTVEQPTPTLVDGRYVLRMVSTEIDAPLIEEHPLFAEDGSPVMEVVEAEQLAVTDEEGNVVTPAKPAVTRPAVHRVPVMEDVEETVEIPAKTERRPTGTQTKSVKYSILYMKAVKALQEAMERIETLEAEVAAIKVV